MACTPGTELRDSCLLVCLWGPLCTPTSQIPSLPFHTNPTFHVPSQAHPPTGPGRSLTLPLEAPLLPHPQHQPCSQALTLHGSCSALSGGGRTRGWEGIASGGGKRCPLPPLPSLSQGPGEPGAPSAAFQLKNWGPRT